MVLWVATPTTPYNVVEMCCCTVLWVLFRVPTTTNVLLYGVVGVTTHNTIHFVKMCCCGYSKQHPQHYTTTHLLKCVVVGTRSNTIQQHTLLMLLLCVTYDDMGVVSSTHSLHPHHFVVVVCHL